jgi:hypothetical protein
MCHVAIVGDSTEVMGDVGGVGSWKEFSSSLCGFLPKFGTNAKKKKKLHILGEKNHPKKKNISPTF